MQRKTLLILWRLAVIITVIVFVYPVKFNLIRDLTLGGFICIWAGALILWWKVIPVRVSCIAVALLTLAVCCVPGERVDPDELRAADLKALTEYDGDRYVWGGEGYLGIDCSGLIRRGAIDGEENIGYRTLNPAALRDAFFMYWHDCSADDLGQGYRGRTRLVENVATLDSADPESLRPGDMAVVGGGEHILAYLGNDVWINADPRWGVINVHVPAQKNAWFEMPARIVRWRSMERT
jgi:hypothetical protein